MASDVLNKWDGKNGDHSQTKTNNNMFLITTDIVAILSEKKKKTNQKNKQDK